MSMYRWMIALLLLGGPLGFTACSEDSLTQDPVTGPSTTEDDNSDENSEENIESITSQTMKIEIGNQTFTATLADNEAAAAFLALLPMTVTMNELNGNEKYCNLASDLPAASYRPGTIRSGDIMLYGSDCAVLFYETFSSSYSYTRIGQVDDPTGLTAAVGTGRVTVTFTAQE